MYNGMFETLGWEKKQHTDEEEDEYSSEATWC